MDYISERQYFDVNTKILYVILILGLLYGLNQTESMEAPVLGEADKEYTKSIKSAKPYLGMLMLTFFFMDLCIHCGPGLDAVGNASQRNWDWIITRIRIIWH
eukprot:984930_1